MFFFYDSNEVVRLLLLLLLLLLAVVVVRPTSVFYFRTVNTIKNAEKKKGKITRHKKSEEATKRLTLWNADRKGVNRIHE